MKLSILICTLKERELMFCRLMNVLHKQITGIDCNWNEYSKYLSGDGFICYENENTILNGIEILWDSDSIKTIGQKRNDLLHRAKGDYTVFIDDDDMIPDYYVPEILKAIETGPDVVGIQGVITTKGKNPKVFKHSIQYDSWYEKDGIYYRCPNHWNPTLRKIMQRVGFPEINYGEDHDYSVRVRPLLKTEVVIDRPMYFYWFDPDKSVALKRRNEP